MVSLVGGLVNYFCRLKLDVPSGVPMGLYSPCAILVVYVVLFHVFVLRYFASAPERLQVFWVMRRCGGVSCAYFVAPKIDTV